MASTSTPPTRDRRAAGTTATGLAGRQRRHDDRRRVLVSQTLNAVRSGMGGRLTRARRLEAARGMLGRMRAR